MIVILDIRKLAKFGLEENVWNDLKEFLKWKRGYFYDQMKEYSSVINF